MRYVLASSQGIAMIRLSAITPQITPARPIQMPNTLTNRESFTHRLTGPFLLQQNNERGAAAYAAMQPSNNNDNLDQAEHFDCYV